MIAWRNRVLFGLSAAALLVLFQRPAAAGETASPEQIATLVHDLGSDQFAIREKASRELVDLGIVTRDALLRAATDADAEVRIRARAILSKVRESDFENRLEAFSADYDGSHHLTLPAWDQFSAQFGASRLSRQLFVEMQRAEPDLLESLAKGAKPASDALAERAQTIFDGQRESLMTLGTLASLLFVGSTEGVTVDEQACANLFPYLVHATYQRSGKLPIWPGVTKKLVARWITKDATPATLHTNLVFASQLEMKPEALSLATRVLTIPSETNSRQVAILTVGRFGDRSHRVLLDKMLDDATVCAVVPIEQPPHQFELQIRDLALAIALLLTEQDLREYGFLSTQPFGASIVQIGTLAFADAAAREAALKKYAAWRAQHPDS
jgi:hypothetical protein